MTKNELMEMARSCAKQAGFDAFAKTLNAPQSLDAGDLVIKLTEHVTNTILELVASEFHDDDDWNESRYTGRAVSEKIRSIKFPAN